MHDLCLVIQTGSLIHSDINTSVSGRVITNEENVCVCVALPDSHSKCVEIFFKHIQCSNALDDHVVNTVHIKLHLSSGITVS